MNEREKFNLEIQKILKTIDEDVLAYDESEFWMIESDWASIEYYAADKQLTNTAIALHLARGLHNGAYRKSKLVKNGLSYHVPYVIHPMHVCRMLMNTQVPMNRDEEDILLATALCHDLLEDVPFECHGEELYTRYHLDQRVYDAVKLVTKRRDFTEEEEYAFFKRIRENKFSLLVKLSDRGNNVEDLYNMSVWKVHEYVEETRKHFIPLCQYGVVNFPELFHSIEILMDKMTTLTEASETLVDLFEAEEKKLTAQERKEREQNNRLRNLWNTYLETGLKVPDVTEIPYDPAGVIDLHGEGLDVDHEMEEYYCAMLYSSVYTYAKENNLTNTMNCLNLLRESLMENCEEEDRAEVFLDYKHCLAAAKAIVDLNVEIPDDKEDVVISVILTHVLHEMLPFDEYPNVFHLDDEIFRRSGLVARPRRMRPSERERRFQAILNDPAALLARLADQSIHAQMLFKKNIWEAQDWIRETRTFDLPLAIAARAKYPEIYMAISVLLEKIKCEMEVMAILSDRYSRREETLIKEIITLKDDNARLFGLIRSVLD